LKLNIYIAAFRGPPNPSQCCH